MSTLTTITGRYIVMTKIKEQLDHSEQSPEMLEGIIEGLFPGHDSSPWPPFVGQLGTGAGDKEMVTDEELAGIAKSLSVGPDGVPNLVLQGLPGCSSLLCRNYWTKESSQVWKRQSLIILLTAGKPAVGITMLD